MDAQQFRTAAHEMIDYIIDYMENIRSRLVVNKTVNVLDSSQRRIEKCIV